MKAIILAAGKGTRLQPITDTIPKVMVEIEGKTLLEYNMEKLVSYVDEFIIVVKYKKESIIDYFGDSYAGIPIHYHVQGEASGTGAALWGIDIVGDCFILTSDQIFNQEDIDALARSSSYGALAKKVAHPEKWGIFHTDQNGQIQEIIEKPKEYVGNLASLLYFKVNAEVIRVAKSIKISERGEYELLEPINNFGKTHQFLVFPLKYPFLDITSKDDLERANLHILNMKKPKFGEAIFLEKIQNFGLFVGIPGDQIETIIRHSQDNEDESLLNNTGDKERFSDYEKFKKWYHDDGRIVFSLIDENGIIAGIWFGRPSLPPTFEHIEEQDLVDRIFENADTIHTGGIRIYRDFRGQGLSHPLITRSSFYYRQIFPDAYMCIDIDAGNIASQKAYLKSGYQYVGLGENKKTIEKNIHPRRIYVEMP